MNAKNETMMTIYAAMALVTLIYAVYTGLFLHEWAKGVFYLVLSHTLTASVRWNNTTRVAIRSAGRTNDRRE